MHSFAHPSYVRDFCKPLPDLDDASILITGGTGSFGQEFVRVVLERYRPKRLIVFSRDELKQSEMAAAFPVETWPAMRYFIGDVRDLKRLEAAMRNVDYVIHAAAMKQVPAAEYNPTECIRTNINGAENVVSATINAGVKKVVALSTDKATNPINLYGASKLASDKIFIAARHISGGGCRFAVARYGNVLGSRGSVAPLFMKLAHKRAPFLPITDARMTRFWVTLAQGVDFVLSSLALMQGGETFVPKIPSAKIVEVASWLAPGIEQRVVGMRPGEKLHEALLSVDDARLTFELPDRYVLLPQMIHGERLNMSLGGRQVAEDFSYTSDNNPEWLKQQAFQAMMGQKLPEEIEILA